MLQILNCVLAFKAKMYFYELRATDFYLLLQLNSKVHWNITRTEITFSRTWFVICCFFILLLRIIRYMCRVEPRLFLWISDKWFLWATTARINSTISGLHFLVELLLICIVRYHVHILFFTDEHVCTKLFDIP